MEFYISPQSGQFYMINVLENQWLSVTYSVRSTKLLAYIFCVERTRNPVTVTVCVLRLARFGAICLCERGISSKKLAYANSHE